MLMAWEYSIQLYEVSFVPVKVKIPHCRINRMVCMAVMAPGEVESKK
jgi:hypothetical protein